MNVVDSEIVTSILLRNGYLYSD
ncbi:MAG TPA: hypothetical protein PK891_03785, partial [Bacteroidales bacterium]|nr:hypothetical protein [Bacteroidales bacterium]